MGHTVPLSPSLSCCLPLLPSPVSVLLKQESEAQQVPPVTWQLYFGWGGFFLLFFSLGSFMIDIFILPLLPKRSFILGFVILKTVLSFFFFSFVCLKWSFLKSSVHVGLCLPVSPLHSHGHWILSVFFIFHLSVCFPWLLGAVEHVIIFYRSVCFVCELLVCVCCLFSCWVYLSISLVLPLCP